MNATKVDFEPLLARLRWAHEGVLELRGLVDEYVARPPYRVTVERRPNGNTIQRAELTDQPPVEISLSMSDIAHQLRATLDNLVGALREGGATAQSAFPIAVDPDKFDRLAFD